MAENLCKNYTPDACAKALVSYLPIGMGEWVHEPHSGGGSFLRALDAKDGVWLTASDLEPDDGITYRDGKRPKRADFLTWDWRSQAGVLPENPPDWIIGNPPYTTAEEHIRRAVEVTGRHVVFVLRLAMLEGVKRADGLWKQTPLREVIVLAPRPSFSGDGRTDAKTAYAAFWWDKYWSKPPQVSWLKWR